MGPVSGGGNAGIAQLWFSPLPTARPMPQPPSPLVQPQPAAAVLPGPAVRTSLRFGALLLELGNELGRQLLGNRLVVRKRNVEAPPPAGHRSQIRRVPQNFGHRNLGADDLGMTALLHTFDLCAA